MSAMSARVSQLRFERHQSVHKMFLNMWGERNHSRQARISLVLTKPPAAALLEFTHPTLVSVCTHRSLSNLNCALASDQRSKMMLSVLQNGECQVHMCIIEIFLLRNKDMAPLT